MKSNSITTKLNKIEEILTEQSKKPLNLAEASQYLSISKSYLYKLTCGNKIPFYKPNGKKIYFAKNELDEWIFRNKVKSSGEIEDEANKYLVKKELKK